MKKLFPKNATKLLSYFALGVMFLGMAAQTASAAILFQDDTFATIESDAIMLGSNDAGANNTAIQFGNDVTPSENGNIQWNIATNRFSVDHPVDVTGDLNTSNGMSVSGGQVNFSSAAGMRLRESSSPNTLAACTTTGEVIMNTTSKSLMVCTTTGAAGVAVWTAPAPAVPSGAADPGTCSVGDLFFNTTSVTLEVCTATNTWGTAGPQDLESVYNKDADKTLTTGGTNFTIAAGAGTVALNEATLNTTSTGATSLSAGAATSSAISLQATNAAGGITANWGTGGLNFSSSTGAFSLSGTGTSTVNATSGNLNLTTTTSGNVALLAAGAGKTITFADPNVTTPIKFSNTATALNGTFPAGAGILDALNSFTSTAAGDGASNVGVAAGLTNITGSDVQAALSSIDSQIGASSANNDVLTFSPQYPNYIIFRDGTNNSGTLVQDYDTTGGDYGSATDPRQQYYGWTTNNAALQDIDIKARFPLPADFVSTGNFTLRYLTKTGTAGNNKVDVTVSNATDLTGSAPTLCGTNAGNTSTTWGTATITAATINGNCTGVTALAAGKIVEIDVKLYAITTGTTFARAGTASLAYNN